MPRGKYQRPPPSAVITIAIPLAVVDLIDEIAERRDVTRSALIRELINDGLTVAMGAKTEAAS
jgi:hypothetical protein